MNDVNFTGRLTRDPEAKGTQGGSQFTTAVIAVDRKYKNKDGVREADFIPFVVFGKSGETALKFMRKGKLVALRGSWRTRPYEDKDKNKRVAHELVVEDFEILEWPEKDGESAPAKTSKAAPVIEVAEDEGLAELYGDLDVDQF